MAANDIKTYLGYLNKLVDKYNKSYHCCINKKSMDADYSALTKEIEADPTGFDNYHRIAVCDHIRVPIFWCI